MPTIQRILQDRFRAAIRLAVGLDADPLVTLAQNPKFGDYQSNAAMGLAKQISQTTGQKANPRAIAEQVKSRLDLADLADEVSIAGPGFINVRLSPGWLAAQLAALLNDPRLGIEATPQPQRTVVDYCGVNIAKQMHVGHLRSTCIGDALSRMIEFAGHPVIRQNHLGDWGTQFGMLLRYLLETSGSADAHIADLEDFYRAAKRRFDEDANFANEARQMVVQLQSGQPQALDLWRRIVDQSRRHFQPLYRRLNTKLTAADERGESFYNPLLGQTVQELRDRGVATDSQGAVVVWVQGFEAPLIVQKSDGGFGYGATDLAAIRYRVRELGARRIIYLADARQQQHFRQIFDAARRAGWIDGASAEHVMFGTIQGPDGKPFKSKSGDNIKLVELLNEAEQRALAIVTQKNPELPAEQRQQIAAAVGIGALKYYDLNRDAIGDYVFDWDKMLALDGNTAPYLQYAYARIRSIFRKAQQRGALGEVAATMELSTPFEQALARQILRLGEVLEIVVADLKPHHLCTYLYELATRFSAFFENCPVIQSQPPLRDSRLALCDLTARVLSQGLDLLGIEHPEQM